MSSRASHTLSLDHWRRRGTVPDRFILKDKKIGVCVPSSVPRIVNDLAAHPPSIFITQVEDCIKRNTTYSDAWTRIQVILELRTTGNILYVGRLCKERDNRKSMLLEQWEGQHDGQIGNQEFEI